MAAGRQKDVSMKRVLICLFGLLTASVLTVSAGDETDFLQETKGWEWLFTEKSDNQRVSYPIETRSEGSSPYRHVQSRAEAVSCDWEEGLEICFLGHPLLTDYRENVAKGSGLSP